MKAYFVGYSLVSVTHTLRIIYLPAGSTSHLQASLTAHLVQVTENSTHCGKITQCSEDSFCKLKAIK